MLIEYSLNMPAIFQSLNTIDANFAAAQSGEPPNPTIDGAFYLPLYNFVRGDYGNSVENWVNGFSINTPTTVEIDITSAENKTWQDNGFSHVSAGTNASYWIFFSATATFDKTVETRNLDTSRAASEVKLRLTCHGGPAKFDIGQGLW